MIALAHSRSGYVKGFATFCLLNGKGEFSENGPYLYIEKMWIHPGHRRKRVLKRMIAEIYAKAVGVHTVYWQSEKRGNRIVKFHISRFEKYLEEDHGWRKLETACAAVAS